MRCIRSTVLIHASAAVAFAVPVRAKPLDLGFELDLSPSIGTALPLDQDVKPMDDSAISGSVVLTSDVIDPLVPIEIRAGTKYDTEFDDDDPTSAAFAKITIGGKDDPLSRFLSSDKMDVSDGQQIYVSFGVTRRYDGFLADYSRTDKAVTIGTRFRNVLTIKGERYRNGVPCSAELCDAASNTKGIYYQLNGEASRTWSTDPLKDRLSPKLTAEIYGPLWGDVVRLYGAADVTWDLYDRPSKGSTGDREDTIAGGSVGLDFTEWAKSKCRSVDALSVSVRYEKGWSNAASERYERIFFLPSLRLAF